MNRRQLESVLQDEFDAPISKSRPVARAAGDLADSGMYRDDADTALTIDHLVDELADAPDEYGLVERWNWWIQSLDLAYGTYHQFSVVNWNDEGAKK